MKFFGRGRKQMIKLIDTKDENRNYPMLDISDMFYEDGEFDKLFKNVSYL